MSLLDTIKAAREEAKEAGTLPSAPKEGEAPTKDDPAQAAAPSAGFSRKSAARAKPKRAAAGSVRVGTKPSSEMSKDERKAAREARRSEADLASDAKRALLRSDEGYRLTQRIWWGLIAVGIVCTMISWLIMRYMQSTGVESGALAAASVALMVVAYVLIIGAFIFDMVKVRPLRNQADARVSGMSRKRMRQLVDEEQRRKAAKKK
ncbi:MAG: hypothetical protein QM302_02060 [Acidobacteriota bacterium]|nr:hypothetical protein [Acidobacteriota bacterium]